MGDLLINVSTGYPVVESNSIKGIRSGALTSQYPVANDAALLNGMLVVVDHEDKLIRYPVTTQENVGLVITEEQLYQNEHGRNRFATTNKKRPRVVKLAEGDIFETNAVDLGDYATVALAKASAKYGLPTESGFIKLVDAATGLAALNTHGLVLQIVEWTALPNHQQGIKFAVVKSAAVMLSDNVSITSFDFLLANNGVALLSDITGVIANDAIVLTVPFGTDVTDLVPTWAISGTMLVNDVEQTSGESAFDFTAPITFTVQSLHGSSKDYTVTVIIEESKDVSITSFDFLLANNETALLSDITGVIVDDTVVLTVPFGTNVTALTPTWAISGTMLVNDVEQTSGESAFDFTAPITFTVQALYGNTKDYTVTVIIEEE